VAIAIEQGKAAMQRAWREQRDEITHDEVPGGGDCCLDWPLAVTRKCMSDDRCVTGIAV
jgi:hypothetical protein